MAQIEVRGPGRRILRGAAMRGPFTHVTGVIRALASVFMALSTFESTFFSSLAMPCSALTPTVRFILTQQSQQSLCRRLTPEISPRRLEGHRDIVKVV